MSYIVVGAGGHSKVVIDIVRMMNEEVLGIIDDHYTGETFRGCPVLGSTDEIERITRGFPNARYVVAIGDNEIRERVVKKLRTERIIFGTAIHPSAIVGSGVTIGQGTVVMPNVVINADANIGEHVILNTSCTVDHDCLIDDYVHISPGAHVAGSVKVGCHTHIGIGSSVIQNRSIGCYVKIGAGACVIDDIQDHTVAVGCPARPIIPNHKG